MAYWSPFPDMDSSELTNTGPIDELEQQQELNPASSEDASTSLNDGFQNFLADSASAMPLFPDPFGQDFTNADNVAQLPTEGQVELENFGVDSTAENFSWANQSNFTAWDVVSQQAEAQPDANTPWPSAPFGGDQSGLHFAHQEMPEMPPMTETPIHCLDAQPSTNQHFGCGPGAEYIPATAGIVGPNPIGGSLLSSFDSDHAGLAAGHSLHVQRGNRYHCLFGPCSRSFNRLPDLFRHQNAYHLQSTTFWCGQPGCERAGPYGRPFPRKDKRTDHEKKVHGGVLSVG